MPLTRALLIDPNVSPDVLITLTSVDKIKQMSCCSELMLEAKHGSSYMMPKDVPECFVGVGGTSKKQIRQLCDVIATTVLTGPKRVFSLDVNGTDILSNTSSRKYFTITLSKIIVLKAFRADKTKDKSEFIKRASNVVVVPPTTSNVKKLSTHGTAAALGIIENIELAEMPGNVLNPDSYVERLLKYNWPTKDTAGKIKRTVLRTDEMEALGMGSFLSVGRASQHESALIRLEYYNADDKEADPVVLVGKGITFDSGGISLKPGAKMDEMKFDMGGSAAVVGAFKNIVLSKAKVNVVALLAVAENMPGSLATRPGDVVTSMSGKTVEILNTDAEGRLVLCDTLTYAAKNFNPSLMIDVATLTGSAVATFGSVVSAVMSNNENLSRDICKLGEQLNDRVWPLPLYQDYKDMLKSKNADLANLGGGAGCITAGAFLSEFVDKKQRWAHLDIAGTAWKNKQSTGRIVELLVALTLKEFGIEHYGAKSS